MSIVNKGKGKARSLGLSLVFYDHVAYWYIEDSLSRLDVNGLLSRRDYLRSCIYRKKCPFQ